MPISPICQSFFETIPKKSVNSREGLVFQVFLMRKVYIIYICAASVSGAQSIQNSSVYPIFASKQGA